MKQAIFCYSKKGMETALLVREALGEEARLFCPERMVTPPFSPLGKPASPFYGRCFRTYDTLIFISSAGLAVREIAPFVRRKDQDPAVISIDDARHFVLPLLSGHIGGANRKAKEIAKAIGAIPVITTATDVRGRFSVDTWAAGEGYAFDLKKAKRFSAMILESDLPLFTEDPVEGPVPEGLFPATSGAFGLAVTTRTKSPFDDALFVVPKALNLGIGCRRGTPEETIREAVEEVFRENSLDPRAIKSVCTVDLKKDEPGLIEFCDRIGAALAIYTADELNALDGEFTESDFVRKTTGTGCVCERAAVKAGGALKVRKTVKNGVTCAVSKEERKIRFEE